MRNRQVTIKDIARELNISTSTVSRALRNKADVNAETRQAVMQAVERLDYQPNQAAMSLVKNRTYTLGVIVPNFEYPFFSAAISGVEEVALSAGYSVIVCQSNEQFQREVTNTRDLVRSRVDGVLASLAYETKSYEHFYRLQNKGIPVVLFDRDGPAIEVSKVLVDNEHAAYRAVEHLISAGCQRIAHLAGPPDFAISSNRMQGYAAALRRHGLPEDADLIIHCNFDRRAGYQAALELLARPARPDGIFAANDAVAIGAMLAARELKLRIPEDVAIVGFNDEPVAELLTPTLTSVRQPAHEIGQMAARMLISQIEEDPETYEPEVHVLQTELIIRESTRRQQE